jgi:hypothetical protein
MLHGCEVYTPNVQKLFFEIKEKSEFYRATEVVPGLVYEVEHYNVQHVERWCRAKYRVEVNADGGMYQCECGLFEHFGVPCRHIVRVSAANFKKTCVRSTIL